MANKTYYKADNVVLTIEDAAVTGKAYQLADFAATEIGSGNLGFFWNVNSISFTATQNTVDKGHVGTDEMDHIATNKTYEASIDMDFYSADADVTLVDGGTTYHAVDPVSIAKQVIDGLGEKYTGVLYIGCDLGTDNANSEEDYALPSTAALSIQLDEVMFTSLPTTYTAGEITTISIPLKVKSSAIL